MSSIVDTLFGGGGGEKATKQQRKENERTREFIEQQQAQARADALGLFSAAGQNRQLGQQAALDVLGQTIPQQFSTFQQGNVGAQQALLAGLPQFQNAILGLPTDLSGLQPQTLQFDPSFAQQQVPQFVSPQFGTPSAPPGSTSVVGDVGGLSGQAGGGGVPSTLAGGSTAGIGQGAGGVGGTGGGISPTGTPQIGFPPNTAGPNPFANTFNASDIERLFGQQDIGSLAQLNLSEQGGNIGRIAGLLTGIPLLGQLGSFIGNRNIAGKTFMSPVNPAAPFAPIGSGATMIRSAFSPNMSFGSGPQDEFILPTTDEN